MTAIKSCECKHVYQDAKHGKGQRVHNKTAKKDGDVWRCTVCAKEK